MFIALAILFASVWDLSLTDECLIYFENYPPLRFRSILRPILNFRLLSFLVSCHYCVKTVSELVNIVFLNSEEAPNLCFIATH